MKSLLSSTLTKPWVLVVLALMFLSIVLFHYVVLFITSSLSVFIFSLSLLNGIYTASSLFFNQGDKSLIQNYRPISLLCSISKVLERLIYNNIIEHVSSSISDFQFGFLQHRSTIHQLLLFLSTIFNSFDQRSQTDYIYLDL